MSELETLRVEIVRLTDALERLTLEVYKLANPPIVVTDIDIDKMEALKPGDIVYSEPVSDKFLTKVHIPEKGWTVNAVLTFGEPILGEGTVDISTD